MRFSIDKGDLEAADISGSDQSWLDRVRMFLRKHRMTNRQLAKEAIRIMHPEMNAAQRKSALHQHLTQLERRVKPVVTDAIRRLVSFLMLLTRNNVPLPVAT